MDGRRYELLRIGLADGSETTVYVVVHPRRATRVRVACFENPQRLDHWCAASNRPEAIVAGFFVRDRWRPLGEVRIDGQIPAEPAGDLVQAGPMLVAAGQVVVDDDREGFSAGAWQFDSDITGGRHPRCALGVNDDELFAVCCDGWRTGVDAGLDLAELGRLLVSLGRRMRSSSTAAGRRPWCTAATC